MPMTAKKYMQGMQRALDGGQLEILDIDGLTLLRVALPMAKLAKGCSLVFSRVETDKIERSGRAASAVLNNADGETVVPLPVSDYGGSGLRLSNLQIVSGPGMSFVLDKLALEPPSKGFLAMLDQVAR